MKHELKMYGTDITGKKYNNLIALCFDHKKKTKGGVKHFWRFVCDCGKEKVIEKCSVISGHTKTCGCHMITQEHRKAMSSSLYNSWRAMYQRCYLKSKTNYKWYGGRGIVVCDEWHNKDNFFKWAAESGYKNGLTLDRIDVNGNYCPENCRWVDKKEQARNTRSNRVLVVNGEVGCLAHFCEKYRIHRNTFYRRLLKGFSIDDCFNKKKREVLK